MSGKVRSGRKGEAKLIVALAGGATISAAASASGICERSAYRHLASPDFRQAVLEARGAMIDQATGRLARTSTKAAGALRKLLASADERVKLAAAVQVLRLGTALRDSVEFEERLSKLEKTLLEKWEKTLLEK